MTYKKDLLPQKPNTDIQQPSIEPEQIQDIGETLKTVDGKVSEIAKKSPSESSSASSYGQGNSKHGSQGYKGDGSVAITERELLRTKLLKSAPSASVMKAQVRKVLKKEQAKLEEDMNKFRRKGQYHHMNITLMRLRRLARQIQEIALLSIEQLKEMWLRVVHNFAQ